jgi:hypothetical protein
VFFISCPVILVLTETTESPISSRHGTSIAAM